MPQEPATPAASDARKGVKRPRSAAQIAASDAKKGQPPTPAQKAANDARKGQPPTPAQKAANDARRAPVYDVSPEEAERKIQAYWDDIQRQDLELIWDDRNVVYDEESANLPGVEYIESVRGSSFAQDQDIQAQNGFLGQDTLRPRIVQEHNEAQLLLPPHQRTRIRAIWSLMRFGRRSRDRIYNDCGPNAPNGRLCPIEQEQLLFNTLQHIMQRGNICIIFQRGLDGLTNSDSLELLLRY